MSRVLVLLALSAPAALAMGNVDFYQDDSENVSASAYESSGSCSEVSYSVNGYVSNNDEERIVNIEASQYDYCGDDYTSYYACASLKVPDEATWERDENTAIVRAKAELRDCGYYSEGGNGGGNPLAGEVLEVELEVTCRVLETSRNICHNRDASRSGFQTGHNVYSSTDCNVDSNNLGTFKFQGRTIDITWAGFGTYKSRDVRTTIPRGRRLA